MSGKINQLALEAFDSINAITSEGVADRHIFEQFWFQEYSQILAELIVLECLRIAEIECDNRYSVARRLESRIKEHFGVY